MRACVIVENEQGAQVCGITMEEAQRLGRDGVYEFSFPGYRLRVIVDDKSEPLPAARVGALPWPSTGQIDSPPST